MFVGFSFSCFCTSRTSAFTHASHECSKARRNPRDFFTYFFRKKKPRKKRDFSFAERVGFEPTVPCEYTRFPSVRLKPLGHLSPATTTSSGPPQPFLAGEPAGDLVAGSIKLFKTFLPSPVLKNFSLLIAISFLSNFSQ